MAKASNWTEKEEEDIAKASDCTDKEQEGFFTRVLNFATKKKQDVWNSVFGQKREQEQDLKNKMEEREREKMMDKINRLQEGKRREDFPVNILCTGKTKELKHRFYETVENLVNSEKLQSLYRAEWITEKEKYFGPCIMIFYLQKKDIKDGLANIINEYSNLTSAMEEKTIDKKPVIMVICDEKHEHTDNIIDKLEIFQCHPIIITTSLKDSSIQDISKLGKYMDTFKELNPAMTLITQEKHLPASVENESKEERSKLSGHKKHVDKPDKVNQGSSGIRNLNPDFNPLAVNSASELVTKHIEVCCCSKPDLPRKAFSSFLDRHLPGYSPVWVEPGEKLKGNFPCFVVCFTLSRITDDVNGVVKELHLPSKGCKAMLIVIQNCAQGLAPGSMLNTYINEKIGCFTNILYDNGICYSCDINSKAATLIDQFVKERI